MNGIIIKQTWNTLRNQEGELENTQSKLQRKYESTYNKQLSQVIVVYHAHILLEIAPNSVIVISSKLNIDIDASNNDVSITENEKEIDSYHKRYILSTFGVNGIVDLKLMPLCLSNSEMISSILNGLLGIASENVIIYNRKCNEFFPVSCFCPGFTKESMVDILSNICQTATKYLRIEQMVDKLQNNDNKDDDDDAKQTGEVVLFGNVCPLLSRNI